MDPSDCTAYEQLVAQLESELVDLQAHYGLPKAIHAAIVSAIDTPQRQRETTRRRSQLLARNPDAAYYMATNWNTYQWPRSRTQGSR